MRHGNLQELGGGIWSVAGSAKLAPGFSLPVRATIVKLQNGGLLIHNPVAFSPETAAAISRLGEVAVILAPNLFHNLFVKRAAALFPDAQIVGPRGIDKKLPGVNFSEFIEEGPSARLGPDFEHVFIGGSPKMNEVVLHHRATSSLIVADYFFNIHETEGFLTPFVLKYFSGAYKKPAQSKLWRAVTKDRAAAKRSAEQVLALDLGRIIMCHGEDVEEGRALASAALRWLTED
jgi:hypothetical protein